MARFQTMVTAVIANRQLIDGIEVQIQEPSVCKEEEAYLKATVQASYEQMEQARTRLLELLHHLEHQARVQEAHGNSSRDGGAIRRGREVSPSRLCL